MKYKVGDRVRVRSDLKACEQYGANIATNSMERLAGKIVTISRVGYAHYLVEGMNYNWTDEMFEPVEEMSAEEAIRLLSEMCASNHACINCPLYTKVREFDIECNIFQNKYPERTIEVLKQWKADHEKKPIETKYVWYVKIIEADTHLLKHEEILEHDFSIPMDHKKEEILKKYCSEHDGKYYAISERRCVVKE